MYFKYGNYTHPVGEIDMVNTTMRRMYSRRNRLMFRRWTMTLVGHFCIQSGEDQDAIKKKISDLEGAYKDGADAVLYHDDHSRSAHYLIAEECINSTRVLSVSFPKGGGEEYATGRTYQIQIQGDVAATNVDPITAFEETVITQGTGGPTWELVPRFIGPPQRNVIFNQSPRRVVQVGMAEGLSGGWPAIPSPILSATYEHFDRRKVQYMSPRISGENALLRYPVTWRFEFSLDTVGFDAAYPHIDYN